MPDEVDDPHSIPELLAERRQLLNLGYRMLGSSVDAEDAVQETYARWYRLGEGERAAIRVPGAWLTRVMSRVCLDVLGSAHRRREWAAGEWLPEPLPTDASRDVRDPLERVTLDDSVTMALLVVLESLTPAERVAFVLHDVFATPFDEVAEILGKSPAAARQLASSARRHVREARTTTVERGQHAAVVRAFQAAVETGRLDELLGVLSPDVVVSADGGGRVRVAPRPISGADKVARFLLGSLARQPRLVVEVRSINGDDGLALVEDGEVAGVMSLETRAGRVRRVWIMLDPEKLRAWRPEAESVEGPGAAG